MNTTTAKELKQDVARALYLQTCDHRDLVQHIVELERRVLQLVGNDPMAAVVRFGEAGMHVVNALHNPQVRP